MAAFQHILFPVDFSDRNVHIAPYVMCMARRYKARTTMLHVMEIPSAAYPAWPEYSLQTDLPAVRDERKRHLESFLADEFQDVTVTRVMLEGEPAWRIEEYVRDQGVDLIMMPTHGYGKFRRFLLGSVTAKLLHDVNCAIWTSAHTPEAPAPPAGYRSVLCAVDLSPASLPLVRWASEFAREQGAALKLAHAIPAAKTPVAFDLEGDRFRGFLFDQAHAQMAKLQQEAGTNLDSVVEGGDVAHVVADAARAGQSDLVVIGRGIMQHTLGNMRTNVYSMIREAPCPVMSVCV